LTKRFCDHCGEEIPDKDSFYTVELNGKQYDFCSIACHEAFVAAHKDEIEKHQLERRNKELDKRHKELEARIHKLEERISSLEMMEMWKEFFPVQFPDLQVASDTNESARLPFVTYTL